MILINIDEILLKNLDLTMVARDASSMIPAPETHNGSNTTSQAA